MKYWNRSQKCTQRPTAALKAGTQGPNPASLRKMLIRQNEWRTALLRLSRHGPALVEGRSRIGPRLVAHKRFYESEAKSRSTAGLLGVICYFRDRFVHSAAGGKMEKCRIGFKFDQCRSAACRFRFRNFTAGSIRRRELCFRLFFANSLHDFIYPVCLMFFHLFSKARLRCADVVVFRPGCGFIWSDLCRTPTLRRSG